MTLIFRSVDADVDELHWLPICRCAHNIPYRQTLVTHTIRRFEESKDLTPVQNGGPLTRSLWITKEQKYVII